MFPYFDLANLVIIFLYFTGSLLFFTATLTKDAHFQFWANIVSIFGFILHSFSLFFVVFTQIPPPGLQGQTLFSLGAWGALLFSFFSYWKLQSGFLSLFILPLAFILFLFSSTGVLHAFPALSVLSDLWFSLYIGTLFFSLNIIILSAASSIPYLSIEKKIKNKTKTPSFSKEFPSLAGFDRFNHFCVLAGFPLCTLGLLSGFIWAFFSSQHDFGREPKEISVLLIWFFYAYLFYRRNFSGWKGKKPAQLSFLLFLLTTVSFLLVHLLASS